MYMHTFEVSNMINKEVFYEIQNTVKTTDKNKWNREKNGMTYFGLSDKGIIIKMFRINKAKYNAYNLKYIISARRVIDNGNYVGLFNTKDYAKLAKKVDKLLADKCRLLPKLDTCTLARFDFCVNAQLENRKQVKAYINTVRRASVPTKLERLTYYDKVSKRKKPMKDDFTVCASEYVEVSVYDKYAQMKKQKKYEYSEKNLKKAENIVRIEIRCLEGKIKALKKKYRIDTIAEFFKYADEIGDYLYRYYLTRIMGTGVICTLPIARCKTALSGYKPENRKALEEYLEIANLERSTAEADRRYRMTDGKKELKRIKFMFENINTNYVTVTARDAKVFAKEYIPTLMELYETYK